MDVFRDLSHAYEYIYILKTFVPYVYYMFLNSIKCINENIYRLFEQDHLDSFGLLWVEVRVGPKRAGILVIRSVQFNDI